MNKMLPRKCKKQRRWRALENAVLNAFHKCIFAIWSKVVRSPILLQMHKQWTNQTLMTQKQVVICCDSDFKISKDYWVPCRNAQGHLVSSHMQGPLGNGAPLTSRTKALPSFWPWPSLHINMSEIGSGSEGPANFLLISWTCWWLRGRDPALLACSMPRGFSFWDKLPEAVSFSFDSVLGMVRT